MSAPSAGMRCAGAQMLGARARQEDVFRIVEFGEDASRAVLVLSDGMGGHAGGQEAAECTVEYFVQSINAHQGALGARLRPALHEANAALAALKMGHRKWLDAGCTLLAVVIEAGRLSWISVGDSPLYLIHRGTVQRLNEDHSMRPVFAELTNKGRMSATADSEANPNRNSLRSAVTGERLALVDERIDAIEFQDGDVLLAASDGIETLAPQDLVQLLSAGGDAAAITDRVLQAVMEVGHPRQDNTTVVIYRTG